MTNPQPIRVEVIGTLCPTCEKKGVQTLMEFIEEDWTDAGKEPASYWCPECEEHHRASEIDADVSEG